MLNTGMLLFWYLVASYPGTTPQSSMPLTRFESPLDQEFCKGKAQAIPRVDMAPTMTSLYYPQYQ